MNTQELMNKRSALVGEARKYLADHTTDVGVSAEDQEVFNKMMADVDNLTAAIENAQKLDRMSAPTSSPILNGVGTVGADNKTKAFNAYLRKGVQNAALQVGTDAEGGYLVPDEFHKELVKALDEANAIRSISRVITTSSGEYKIPVMNGHAQAAWTDEEDAYSESEPTFSQTTLGAHKMTVYSKVSKELLNDSAFNVEQLLAEDFGRAFGIKEEAAFISGDGSSKPTGILSANADVTTASATKITADELLDLFFSLKTGYSRNATWVMNYSTIKEIRKLKDGNGNYIWTPALTVGAPDLLLGRPVVTADAMPTIATGNKTIIFGDFHYFWVADRQRRTVQRLNELFALTGQIGFCAMQRVDAKVVLGEAFKILKQA